MLRATRVRLIIDFCVQLALFVFLIVELILHPTLNGLLFYTSIFGIVLSVWQILHALYVVKKYKDWQRKKYLNNMKQVLAYGLLTLGIGVFMLIVSFGFLSAFFFFTVHVLHWVLSAVVIFLAAKYFITSLKRLCDYYDRPKSFWDLK